MRVQFLPRTLTLLIRPVSIHATKVQHGVWPKTAWKVGAAQQATHVLFHYAHSAFRTRIECVSVCCSCLHRDMMIVTEGLECSAFGKLRCAVKANAIDLEAR